MCVLLFSNLIYDKSLCSLLLLFCFVVVIVFVLFNKINLFVVAFFRVCSSLVFFSVSVFYSVL